MYLTGKSHAASVTALRQCHDIYAILDERQRSPIDEMIRAAHPNERRKYLTRILMLADHPLHQSPNFMPVQGGDGIWKLKASEHIRIWFFEHGSDLILTNALRKTKREEDPSALRKAKALRQEYLQETL